jgi:PAS domain S-box-containing protein
MKRPEAEPGLDKARRHWQAVFEHLPDVVLLANDKGRCIDANPAVEKVLGYRREECLGRFVWEIAPVADYEPGRTFWPDFLVEGQRQGEHVIERKGGITLEVEYRAVANIVPGIHLWTLRDISQQRHAEERFRLAVEHAPSARVMVDRDGRIVLVNKETERLFGYSRDELLGQLVEVLVPGRFRDRHPDERRAYYANPSARPMGAGRDLYGRRKDGTEFPVEIDLNPIATEHGLFVLSAIVDISARKRAEEELRQNADAMRALSRRLLEAQELERRHLARELHDQLGQVLTTVSLYLQAGLAVAGSATRPFLQDGQAAIHTALEQVRDLSLSLRPSVLDALGLQAALEWYCERQAQRASFALHLDARLGESRLPADIEVAAFRIVQEALTNAVRHAQAQHVWVHVDRGAADLHVVVRDDGVGFDLGAGRLGTNQGKSLGLLSLADRAQLVGGTLDIDAQPGRGVTVSARLPVTTSPHEGSKETPP